MKWIKSFSGLSKKEQFAHLVIWTIGLLLINIPSWRVTLGPFHSDDFSLIIPSLYGVILNTHLFYASALTIERSGFDDSWRRIRDTMLIFLAVTLIESVLDAGYYLIHYWGIRLEVITEIIFGQFLMNFIFFYLPSLMYGFIKAWQRSESESKDEPKLIIKNGHQKIHLSLNLLSHVESDGNYCIYHEGKKYLIRQSLAQAQSELPDYFVRCHKSFIVNTKLIQKRSYDELVVGGFVVPIGRKYRANFNDTVATQLAS